MGVCKSETTFWILIELDWTVLGYNIKLLRSWDIQKVMMSFDDVRKTFFAKNPKKLSNWLNFASNHLNRVSWINIQIWPKISFYGPFFDPPEPQPSSTTIKTARELDHRVFCLNATAKYCYDIHSTFQRIRYAQSAKISFWHPYLRGSSLAYLQVAIRY